MSAIKISSVKLINYGTKGIEVSYSNPSKKNNRQFMDEYKAKRKAPIHEELETTFSWLKDHVLNICSYTNEETDREYLKNNLEMISVKVDKGGFVLAGELKILDGTKTLKLETPLIMDDIEYPEANDVVKIINGIFAETMEYIEGKKSLSDTQIIMKFASKEDGFDAERVKSMSPAEQKDWATQILQDQGHMVIHSDELEDDDSQEEIVSEIAPVKEKAITKKAKTEPKATIAPEPEPLPTSNQWNTQLEGPGETRQPEVNPYPEAEEDFSLSGGPSSPAASSEEDFSLGLTPAENKSTAKRKVS